MSRFHALAIGILAGLLEAVEAIVRRKATKLKTLPSNLHNCHPSPLSSPSKFTE